MGMQESNTSFRLHAFILHVLSATTRRPTVERLLAMLNRSALVESVRVLAAVTESDVHIASLKQSGVIAADWNVHPRNVAVALSHMNVWKLVARRNIAFALVLEDDVVLRPRCLDGIQAVLELKE